MSGGRIGREPHCSIEIPWSGAAPTAPTAEAGVSIRTGVCTMANCDGTRRAVLILMVCVAVASVGRAAGSDPPCNATVRPPNAGERIAHVDSTIPGCCEVWYCAEDDSLKGSYWALCRGGDMINETFGTWVAPGCPSRTARMLLPPDVAPEDARGAIAAVRHRMGRNELVVNVAPATARRIKDWKLDGPHKLKWVLSVFVVDDSTEATRELRAKWSGGKWETVGPQ